MMLHAEICFKSKFHWVA